MSYMRSVVKRNVVIRDTPVFLLVGEADIGSFPLVQFPYCPMLTAK
jgi:hypothetical protein